MLIAGEDSFDVASSNIMSAAAVYSAEASLGLGLAPPRTADQKAAGTAQSAMNLPTGGVGTISGNSSSPQTQVSAMGSLLKRKGKEMK
jgi:hypothetical protein